MRTDVELAVGRGSGIRGIDGHSSGFGSLVAIARERCGTGVVGDLDVVSGDLEGGLGGGSADSDGSRLRNHHSRLMRVHVIAFGIEFQTCSETVRASYAPRVARNGGMNASLIGFGSEDYGS